MHILMISDVYFPRINGVSTSIQTFREGLKAEGVRVTLVAPHYDKTRHIEIDDANDIVRIPASSIPFDPEDRLMHRKQLGQLSQVLASPQFGRFDLIHVQTPFLAHYTGLRLSRELGIPCIATYHTHFEEYFHHYLPILPRPLAKALTRRIARSQCNALDAVIVPSLAMREALTHYGVTRPLHILPTGIPIAQFGEASGADFRQRHQLPIDRPLALYVGRVAHEKNLNFLLEATAHARQLEPQLGLIIAGEGPALPSLRRHAEKLGLTNDVFFVGYLERSRELPECYAAADLFAFPSVTETQGLVLLEAMAAGLPVLGIPAMGAADILGPQKGAVCAPHEVIGFGQLMAELLVDQPRLSELAAAGRIYAQEWAAPERARQLATLYKTFTAHWHTQREETSQNKTSYAPPLPHHNNATTTQSPS